MADQLVVIPKQQLRRGYRIAKARRNVGIAATLVGLTSWASLVFLDLELTSQVIVFIGSALLTGLGGAGLLPARRSTATLEAKLEEQELPAARLVRDR